MLKFYGSDICGGCREAKALFTEKKVPYEFIDITENVKNLRDFLYYRDILPMFDEIRRDGRIGIPFFVEGERMTLDENEAMSWALSL